jgi:voltage-gated sodium channel
MIQLCKRLADSDGFQSLILFLIVVTALSLALESVPEVSNDFGPLFIALDTTAQVLFGVEIAVRIISYAPQVGRFFRSGWNVFDFIIVVASFLPVVGSFALVARLVRVLRVLRVLSVSERMRGFMEHLFESFDEVACTVIIATIFGYIFTISGHYLFYEVDPARWGTLGRAALSVFYLLLLQDVPSVAQPLLAASRAAILFFLLLYVSFLSLLIGVIAASITQSLRKTDD